MTPPGPLVPGLVEVRVPVLGPGQLVHRPRAGRGHVDVKDLGELRLGHPAGQERPAGRPQHLLVGGAGHDRPGRAHEPAVHHLATLAGRGQETGFLVREVVVKGRPRDPGALDDVGHRHHRVVRLGDRRHYRPQQPFTLRRLYGRGRQPAAAAWQPRLAFVRVGEGPARHPLPAVHHAPRVSGKYLKYVDVLLGILLLWPGFLQAGPTQRGAHGNNRGRHHRTLRAGADDVGLVAQAAEPLSRYRPAGAVP